ncbi:histone family protein DNA-binding protein [Desulfobulbus propionicus DSM 2032]|jgi:DNA-binding protein HU-beta|uniref:Histone family protein DNA-binding protein n=1 Tax=Desulfobulbus propionicus (strain ATCC 33891 / DSM 2032 / VKM B-1956 / 1pr3) TaxID=577650 RepID=A0A7U3YP10_DESPD|nr:HU family DNA-binding protein [Desulfobulbus propionicus]ADW18773.1 histone family protein DNA-binding protein [Desulfobulbus propionicus DSM 2032]
MNKSDLIESIAHSAQISKIAAERGLNGLLSTLSAAITEGKRVTLVGFGSFSVVDRAPRKGRNPKTGETVPIPPRRVVKFRPGKELAGKILCD